VSFGVKTRLIKYELTVTVPTLRRLLIFNRDRFAAHDPNRNVTEQSFPLFPDVIGMSFIVRKLKIVPPLNTRLLTCKILAAAAINRTLNHFRTSRSLHPP
jgi:hypothetical protein